MKWIPYVEIRSSATREVIGIIEGAELEFNYNWNGCGDFEIYCRATENNLKLLKNGYYVTLPNEVDYSDDMGTYCNIWRIQKVQRQNARIGGRYIIATGKEAKCIVGNRIIRKPATTLVGNLREQIYEKIFAPNIINPIIYGDLSTYSNRTISNFYFSGNPIDRTIENETQVSYENILDFTEQLYATYNCGAKLRLNRKDLGFYYQIYVGTDRSDRVVFSQANENILSTDYTEDKSNYKTYVLVGGEGEGLDRKVLSVEVKGSQSDLVDENGYTRDVDRYEIFVDANDITSTYKITNESGEEVDATYEPEVYYGFLRARGYEKQSAEYSIVESFSGEIDTTNKRYKFNEAYYLGDLVKIRDNDFGNEKKVQVSKFTRVQNMEGYKEYFSHEVEEV